jgi:hypothetical protein
MNQRHRSVGTTLLVTFFAAGALICLVTMLALAFPGGFLEPTTLDWPFQNKSGPTAVDRRIIIDADQVTTLSNVADKA